MKMKITFGALTVAMMAIGPLSSSFIPNAGIDAAFAERGGNGNGNGGGGNGNGGGKSASADNDGGNGRGSVASELKGLNAAHANPNALLHASPNSQVGRIASYKTAALETVAAQAALDGLTEPTRTAAEIEEEMDLLDPDVEADAGALADVAEAALAEADALSAAANGRTLSDAAVNELRDLLDI